MRFIFGLFFLLSFSLNGQVEVDFQKKNQKKIKVAQSEIDLSGLWEGEVSQLNWMGQPEFRGTTGRLHVEIEQEGDQVKGLFVCRTKFADNKGYLYYEKKFTGRWNGEQLTYQDVSVDNYINTHRDLRHLETCLKSAKLNFYKTSKHIHLEGIWEGKGHITDVPCPAGEIHLTKVNEDEFMVEEAQTINVNFEKNKKAPVDVSWTEDNKVKKIKKRSVKEGHKVEVKSKVISITVYDHKKNDGDIISLNYNGNWILEKYVINNTEHKVDVFLDAHKKAPDYLLLFAHNLGKYPPNTVAVIVDDGVSRQRFILNSDMNTSDVIYFKYSGS